MECILPVVILTIHESMRLVKRRHERIKQYQYRWKPCGLKATDIILNDLSSTMSRVRGVYSTHALILIKTQRLICDRQPFDVFRCVHLFVNTQSN